MTTIVKNPDGSYNVTSPQVVKVTVADLKMQLKNLQTSSELMKSQYELQLKAVSDRVNDLLVKIDAIEAIESQESQTQP